jgi:diguanylate cyclase (GGDEF)-like protein
MDGEAVSTGSARPRPAPGGSVLSTAASSASPASPMRRLGRRLTGLAGVRALTIALGVGGLAFLVGVVRHLDRPQTELALPVWALVCLFALAEMLPVHLHRGRDAHSFSLSEIPLVLGLVGAAPVALVLARVVGAGGALALIRRQQGTKLAFNLAHLLVEVAIAVWVFHMVAGAHPSVVDERTWLAALAATAATHVYGCLAVTAVISLHEGKLQADDLGSTFAAGAGAATVNTSLALVSLLAVAENPWVLTLLAVLVAVSAAGYRSYSNLRQGYGRLELLYGFTGAVGRTVEIDQAASTVLVEARTLLRAGRAALVWIDERSGRATYWVLGDGEPAPVEVAPEELALHWWAPALRGEAVLAPRGAKDLLVRAALHDAGLHDGLAVPLRSDDRIAGVLMVADRLDEVSTFGAEDLKLFGALANHARVALENGRLLEKEYQALHDALTGLPNRRLFAIAVRNALAEQTGASGQVAVLLMDLNGFKEVNDTLGHATGDTLLVEVGRRLTSALPTGATLARLGGDEFSVVIPGVADANEAYEHAVNLLSALRRPYELPQLTLDVSASIGVAISPDHGEDGPSLLKKADMAMYSAKSRASGVEVYALDVDSSNVRRLALTAELRRAVDERAIAVHFQPKVELITGRVVGAEALVRWTHPTLGAVEPDEFIPIAEHTGLIKAMTRSVLETALEHCARWREVAPAITVAVNISARSLVDLDLPAQVEALLKRNGLPPEALVLEITESAVLREPTRTLAVVARLRHLGVTLSLDDFGTGHSSLAHLKRLPVSELKIDRSFVTSMATDRGDACIVAATVALGHSLGMRVVAEGVEDEAAWAKLVETGCDDAQGFFVARAMPGEAFAAWLRRRNPIGEAARADEAFVVG